MTTLTQQQITDLINKLGGDEGALHFIENESNEDITEYQKQWHKKNDLIHFSVITDGKKKSIKKWNKMLFADENFAIKELLKEKLNDYQPEEQNKYEIVILTNYDNTTHLYLSDTREKNKHDNKINKLIRKKAEKLNLIPPPSWEIALLIAKFLITTHLLQKMQINSVCIMHTIDDNNESHDLCINLISYFNVNADREPYPRLCYGGSTNCYKCNNVFFNKGIVFIKKT
jgi:protein-arginine kinase